MFADGNRHVLLPSSSQTRNPSHLTYLYGMTSPVTERESGEHVAFEGCVVRFSEEAEIVTDADEEVS